MPADVFSVAQAVYGTGSEDDDKRVYRTLQVALEAGAGLIPHALHPTHEPLHRSACRRSFRRERASHPRSPGPPVWPVYRSPWEKAMDVEGGPLSGYLPLFIGRTEADAYDRISDAAHLPKSEGLVSCHDYLTAPIQVNGGFACGRQTP